MSFINNIRSLFEFTPNERKGIFVLLIILVMVIAARIGLPYLQPDFNGQNILFDHIEVSDFYQDNTQKINNKLSASIKSKKPFRDSTIKFDPNLALYSTLLEVGFSKFAAKNLIKYRESGGLINNSDDLFKIYGIDSIFVGKIHNQVEIVQTVKEPKITLKRRVLIEINSANADTLQYIPCIGPVISKRIIKYRSQLGGFVSLNQLGEVYGVDSSCFNNLMAYLAIDINLIHKINLNTASPKVLFRHPYITSHQAKAILKYRELMGSFTEISQLKDNYFFTELELQHLLAYLSLND